MSQAFDLIVFDWDGTLMDSTAHITRAIQHACADLGLAVPDARQARAVIGLSLAEALATACPDLPPDRYPEMVTAYRNHFFIGDEEVDLFAGVDAALAELSAGSALLAVATGKSRRGLERALTATGLARTFAATRTQDDCPSKPHPAMLLELMDQLGAAPGRTLMVGDTTHDLRMAEAAGTLAAGVLSGAHTREELATCPTLGLFEDFEAFYAWLKTQTT
ncbi:MAG: HAD-IA family hydrolase [Paludibacterium sp.]|uniref:HAD-IA family hydrolase n=1 Tax=Paludibacterium sp. TaxID=1917523 RepID=UPI0025F778D5|nr:HAD-IA family hydrolase [Paludibacterium sp.]MBV8049207.1 HAD-IA family hydrolase [Paludibacterium sp.]MBV8647252.1 HAD-IA family hydrolase [Paludibacterium sp.]